MLSIKAAIAILLLGEAAVAVWQYTPIEPSTAPVFSFPPAAANFGKTPAMVKATEVYAADRGGECDLTTPGGEKITVFYFEWDKIKAGPMMAATGHAPEECNVPAGFTLVENAPRRVYSIPGQAPLEFDATVFVDPSGKTVFMYKLAWLQGLGSRDFREGFDRAARTRNAFLRHVGSSRVLQGAVSGARDSDHAWNLFTNEVLDKLKWQ